MSFPKTISKKILIVINEENVREHLKTILSDHYDLIVTEQGDQALDILNYSKGIKLIFMDVNASRNNGLETIKKIQTKHPTIKVIILTDHRSVEIAQEAVRLGAKGYIVKPLKSDQILSWANNAMSA